MTPRIAMIAAVARNNVIGADGSLPWRIRSDMRFFRETTMGKPLVMGRKQFETVGKPLKGRTNIVVTRQEGYQPDGVIVLNDLDAALDHARNIANADGVDEVMVIGGGEIYAQALERTDRLYISHVDLAPEGSVQFPRINLGEWRVMSTEPVAPGPDDDAGYTIRVYDRISGDQSH